MLTRKVLSLLCASSILMSGSVLAEEPAPAVGFEASADELTAENVSDIQSTNDAAVSMEFGTEEDALPDEECEELGTAELMALKFDGGSGTEEDPYLISTEAQLALVADIPTKCFKLTKDIALEGDWITLGEYGDAFSGVFDGGGFTVSNMNVKDGSGFFREVTGTVRNLNVEGNVTSTKQYTGGLAGKSSGSFESCSFSGSVTSNYGDGSTSSPIGGLIGYQERGSLKDCFTTCDVSGDNHVGGLIGYASCYNNINELNIKNCYASGKVIGDSCVGGLAGYFKALIENCHSTGDIYGDDSVGGLIGGGRGTIKNSYAECDLYPTKNGGDAGGLVGYTSGYITIIGCYAIGNIKENKNDTDVYRFYRCAGLVGSPDGYNTTIIRNCFFRGSMIGSTYVAGLATYSSYSNIDINIENSYAACTLSASNKYGLSDSGTAVNSYYDSQLSGCNDTNHGTPKTTAGMKNQLIYDGWDFDDVWTIDESGQTNDGYPYLQWAFKDSVRLTDIRLDKTNAEIKIGSTLTLNAVAE